LYSERGDDVFGSVQTFLLLNC